MRRVSTWPVLCMRCQIAGTECPKFRRGFSREQRVMSVYVLTIVFLVSQVSVVSLHASRDACELAAERARLFNVGPQAVGSARCEPQMAAVAANK